MKSSNHCLICASALFQPDWLYIVAPDLISTNKTGFGGVEQRNQPVLVIPVWALGMDESSLLRRINELNGCMVYHILHQLPPCDLESPDHMLRPQDIGGR